MTLTEKLVSALGTDVTYGEISTQLTYEIFKDLI